MTNILRALCALGLSSSLSLSLVACSNDDQSLGKNNLASTGGGNGGNAGAGSNTNTAGSGGTSTNTAGSAGAPTVDPTTRRICDGSDGITLGHTTRGGGQIEAISAVVFEAGFGSFYVDGHCNYWVINAEFSRFAPARTGKLTETEEAQLAQDVGYAALPGLQGSQNHCKVQADGSTTFLFDRAGAAICNGNVDSSTTPALASALTNARTWRETFVANGVPLTGPIRLRASRSDNDWKTHPLPVSFSLATVAVSPTEILFGDAPVVGSAGDLDALRSLRALVLAEDISTSSLFEVLGTDGLRYRIAFRDALPIEDEHGLVPIPGVPSGN